MFMHPPFIHRGGVGDRQHELLEETSHLQNRRSTGCFWVPAMALLAHVCIVLATFQIHHCI